MKKYLSLILTALLILAVGCSKTDLGDAEGLLQTVPADANAVAVVNLQKMADAFGCKSDGKKITLSSEAKLALDNAAMPADAKKTIMDICEGESGIALTSLVYFSAARDYLTGVLDDPDKFVSFMQKHESNDSTSVEVTTVGDARIVGHTVVIGNQFWASYPGAPDEEQLQHYKTLKGPQSFAANEAASRLISDKDVVTFVADINKALSEMPYKKEIRMGLAFLLDDATYVAGGISVDKTTVNLQASVLNSDLKPASLLVPTEKIDTGMVKDFDGTATAFLAMGLSKELLKKIGDLSSVSGGKSGGMAEALSQIEGTVALRVGGKSSDNIEARVHASGKDLIQLTQMLQFFGVNVVRDDDLLILSVGDHDYDGSLTSVDAASAFKGAWIAAMVSDVPARDTKTILTIKEEKKSLVLDMKMEGGLEALASMIMK